MSRLVSVIMPAYNAGSTVLAAVRSILNQSFDDFEFVIVDDGSTDETHAVLAGLRDSRIRIIRHEENKGVVASLNTGIAATEGMLIARMDADDLSHRDRLGLQATWLREHPHLALVGTQVEIFTDPPQRVWRSPYTLPFGPGHVRWRLHFGNALGHPTVMGRRTLFEEHDGYDPDAWPAEDYDLWASASRTMDLANLHQRLVRLRYDPASTSRRNSELREEKAERVTHATLQHTLGMTVSRDTVRLLRNPRRVSGIPRPVLHERVTDAVRILDCVTTACLRNVREPWEATQLERDANYLLARLTLLAARYELSALRAVQDCQVRLTATELWRTMLRSVVTSLRNRARLPRALRGQ